MNPVVSPHELPANLLYMLAVVPLLQWAKATPRLAWVNATTVRWWSILLAGLGELGIHTTYTAGAVTITFTIAGVLTGLGLWAREALGQHYTYKVVAALDALPAVSTALQATIQPLLDVAVPAPTPPPRPSLIVHPFSGATVPAPMPSPSAPPPQAGPES